jgi:hypothetical protein
LVSSLSQHGIDSSRLAIGERLSLGLDSFRSSGLHVLLFCPLSISHVHHKKNDFSIGGVWNSLYGQRRNKKEYDLRPKQLRLPTGVQGTRMRHENHLFRVEIKKRGKIDKIDLIVAMNEEAVRRAYELEPGEKIYITPG